MTNGMDLRRWRADEPDNDTETRLAVLFDDADTAVPLSTRSRQRILQALRASTGARRGWRWAPALAAALVLLSGVAVATRVMLRSPTAPPKQVKQMEEQPTTKRARLHNEGKQTEPAKVPEVVVAHAPAAFEAEVKPPATQVRPAPVRHPRKPQVALRPQPLTAAPDPPAPSGEAALLAEVFRHLNVLHDAKGALVLLDTFDGRFSQPTLAREAIVARVSAQMALGDDRAAMTTLDGLGRWTANADRGLAATRGELRARDERYGPALEDLAFVLDASIHDDLHERALHAKAHCLWKLGRVDESSATVRHYLDLFPNGRFARDLENALPPALRASDAEKYDGL